MLSFAALLLGCSNPLSPGTGTTVDRVEIPVITPDSGTISDVAEIFMTSGTPGAEIYYTTDGTVPTDTDNLYSSPFTLPAGSDYAVMAFARFGGLTDSDFATADYTVNLTVTPVVFSEVDGAIPDNQLIMMSSTTVGADIYFTYTVDGSEPAIPAVTDNLFDDMNPPAMTTLGAADTLNIKAYAVLAGYNDSSVSTVGYTKAQTAASGYFYDDGVTITGVLDGDTFSDTMAITLNSDTAGAAIYYLITTDGSEPADPDAASIPYTVPVQLTVVGTTKLKAVSILSGYTDSLISGVSVNVEAQAGVPVVNIASGFVASGTDVTLTVSNSETIYYTLDGSDPAMSGLTYLAPITLTASVTLRTYAGGTGYYPSDEVITEYKVYETIDTLSTDSSALMAVASDGSLVIRAGGSYHDLTAGTLIARTVTEPSGAVLDFTFDAAGDLHAIYLVGTDLVYWTSDTLIGSSGTIGSVNTAPVTLADARILIDSTGNARIVFAQGTDVMESVYTSTGVSVSNDSKTLLDIVQGLDAAIDSNDRVYIAASRTKNATQTTGVGYFDSGWIEYLAEINNRSNPALTVDDANKPFLAYVRTDKSWFFLNDFVNDVKLGTTVNQVISGDSVIAYDADGILYISSHDSVWTYDAAVETATPFAESPYRIATDPAGSGTASMFILGTSGLTLYAMK